MSTAVPTANSASAAEGATWFKIWEDPPVYENGELVFPSQSTRPYLSFLDEISDDLLYSKLKRPSPSPFPPRHPAASTSFVANRYDSHSFVIRQ